ncbi:hypothetical protein GUJ93_ZPchr0007g5907 [Zizania palustris]|uniref:RRM domain-containing protein n=1 Tax=Zizania palustris TaxID=103762 RepID=A0A8J5SV81_ZIZPA|nr:hypothetical protein GUJ93_ZPchr0007g5907 [Zizania palustris]
MQPPPPPHVWATAPPYCYHGPPPSPPPQQQQQVAPEEEKGAGWGADGARSLWIGGLLPWMDEGYLSSCFSRSPEVTLLVSVPRCPCCYYLSESASGSNAYAIASRASNFLSLAVTHINHSLSLHQSINQYVFPQRFHPMQLVSVVIKRNKQTGQSEGFGFLNFADHVTADQILQSYNGQEMPNAGRDFKLNWVTTTAPETRVADDPDHAIYVGDLAYDVTDFMLHHVFKSRYPSVKSAKVIWDRVTGRSKGYGFVLFGDVNEHRQAMTEMNGAYCSTMPMRIRPAPDKKILSHNTQGTDSDYNPNNSRLFVGSLDPSVTDEDLKQAFNPYGDIVNVKVIVGKRCGFVEYSSRYLFCYHMVSKYCSVDCCTSQAADQISDICTL